MNLAKTAVKNKVKKIVIKMIKPFIPFILIVVLLLFAVCFLCDTLFVQGVQADDSSLSSEERKLKNLCIEMADHLNTCDNYLDNKKTNKLLDVDARENDKKVEWSHLYTLIKFSSTTNNRETDEDLLKEISTHFESTFRYEKDTVKIETTTTTTDDKGNKKTKTDTKEETQYILVESNTIIGHYKYNYEQKTTQKDNVKTTKKVFTGEELIGQKYERLREYLKKYLNVKDSDLDIDVELIIQSASGYYDGKESTNFLPSSSTDTTIVKGSGRIPKGMFTWPIPGYTRVTSHFGMRLHPIYKTYRLHRGMDVGAPIGANFVAAADGKVIKACYNSSYGNMVMISHGNGVVTLYAHGSKILVKTNQTVKQGQAILKVRFYWRFYRTTCTF